MVTRRRGGFVLVLTLALLVLAATVLATVGRRSVRHALAAKQAREELQRRWGTISCQRTVLPRIEELLIQNERANRRVAASLRALIVLGGQRFDLVLADEQAKANVNVLLDEAPSQQVVEDRIRRALAGSGHSRNVHLHPGLKPPKTAATAPTTQTTQPVNPVPIVIFAYGQILEGVPPRDLVDGPADLLTCWGTGSINIRRATPAALRLAASPPLTGVEIERIIAARDARRSAPSTQPAQIPHPPGTHFVEHSSCHSLWIIADDGRRQWHELTVVDEADPNRPQVRKLVW